MNTRYKKHLEAFKNPVVSIVSYESLKHIYSLILFNKA